MSWVVTLVVAVIGSGGVVSWYKARQDAKKGIREADLSEDTAISDQWRQIIEVQSKQLLDPLVSTVSSLRAEVTVLNAKVEKLEAERKVWIENEALLWQWADILVKHINEELPPPAPERPAGLGAKR